MNFPDEKHVEKNLDTFEKLTKQTHLFLGSQPQHAEKFANSAKTLYDFTKSLEIKTHQDTLSQLIIENFDEEQTWQQIELQNNFSVTDLLSSLSHLLTCKKILNFCVDKQKKDDSERNEEVKSSDKSVEHDFQASGSDSSDEEVTKIKTRLKVDKNFDNFSNSEDDLDFDFDAAADQIEAFDSGDEKSDYGTDYVSGSLQSKDVAGHPKEKRNKVNIKQSVVDDKFFKLSELEDFLNQEDSKEEKKLRKGTRSKENENEDGDEEEDIDLFGDLPSDDEEKRTRTLKYKDFFDPPISGDKRVKFTDHANNDDGDDMSEKDEQEGEEDDNSESDDSDSHGYEKDNVPRNLLAGSDSESDGEDAEEILGIKKDVKSNFEKRQEKLKKQIKKMEETSIAKKPWQLRGEVAGSNRPENSLLEEHLEFEHTTRLPPVITEETTKSLEDIIIQRIKDKAWDDVERKIKPKEDPFEYRKRIVLDQEKSKKSLGEIYEEQFLKQQQTEEGDKENPEHTAIKNMMQSLFTKLDALSNFHYTPKMVNTEVKIVSNLPSVNMEEVAPVSVSEAKLLAPEEIQENIKANEKGTTEKTETDRKRERRKKKLNKRTKIKEKEKRLKLVEKLHPGLGNKYSKEKALKKLEKESKFSKDVTVVKESKKKASMSSSKFFKQLQEEVTTQIKAKKAEKRKNDDKDKISSKKLKL